MSGERAGPAGGHDAPAAHRVDAAPGPDRARAARGAHDLGGVPRPRRRPGPLLPVRRLLGARRTGVLVLVSLLLVTALPLVVLPAVRCEVFGLGCPPPSRSPAPGTPAGDAPRPPAPSEIAARGHYLALGDSYASGEGAYGDPADLAPGNRCRRTSKAYYHSLARTFRFAGGSSFWACSGATTRDVLRGKNGEPAQTGRAGARTSLVTISVGGNDAGFSRVLAACIIKLPLGPGCRAQSDEIAARLATLRTTLPAVLDALHDRAPSARILVLGYPRIFAETAGAGLGTIAVADQRWLNGKAAELNELIRVAATEADRRISAGHGEGSVEFVDAFTGFAGHEIGSADPYVNGLEVDLATLSALPRSFHPTEAGYRRLAELFAHQINMGPGRPIQVSR